MTILNNNKPDQLDLFIKTWKKCKCARPQKHVFTYEEFSYNLTKLERIVSLIKGHGWNLSYNYYDIDCQLDRNCGAWTMDNTPYLSLRGSFTEEYNTVAIPLRMDNPKVY